MEAVTKEYLDQKLDTQAEKILGLVKFGFDEINKKFENIDKRLADLEDRFESLTTSVDRFSKIFTDLNQEVIILRKQLRDAEQRIEKIGANLA